MWERLIRALHAFTGVAELKRHPQFADDFVSRRLHAFTGVAELKRQRL